MCAREQAGKLVLRKGITVKSSQAGVKPKTEFQIFYERNLPHIQPPGVVLFLTYRLVNSVPSHILRRLNAEAERISAAVSGMPDDEETAEYAYKEQIRLFGKWDAVLDNPHSGPLWLADSRIAREVAGSLHFLDGKSIDLDSYSIMANHAHALFKPLIDPATGALHSLRSIMQSHKGYTARECNKILGRKGQLWQHESFDHYVRDEGELQRIRRYVLMNPVSAGLVEEWDEWAWTYCKYL
jgi:putative transposase